MNYPEPTEEPSPFDELETGGELAAFVYKKYGSDSLRHFLAHDGNMLTTREWVLDIAAELGAAGLSKAAHIATEIAATKPPMTDMIFCPYMKPPYTDNRRSNENNIHCWLRAQRYRQRRSELKRQQRFKPKPNKAIIPP